MATTWAPDEALFRLSIANLAATAPVSPAEEKRLIDVMVEGKKAAYRLNHPALRPDERDRLQQIYRTRAKFGGIVSGRRVRAN